MTKPFKHRCAMCDLPAKLSKEHIWSKWTRTLIQHDVKQHQHMQIVWGPEGPTESRRTYGGDARNRSPRAVCADCNNGWMSRLETAAKPFVIMLIKGERAILDAEAQRLVASWIALKSMVAEYFEPEKVAVSSSERQYLRDQLKPPENWRIWIGNYERGTWMGQWTHGVVGVHSERSPARDLNRPNTQATTFVVGHLYANVFSSEVRSLVDGASLGNIGLTKLAEIWPIREQVIAWPTNPLGDTDARICATALHDELRTLFPAVSGV